MPVLTLGLIGLSAAFLTRGLAQDRPAPVFWALSASAALAVFLGDPPSFAEVTLWAGAALVVWVPVVSGARPAILCSGVAGFLIGAAAPFLTHSLGQSFAALADLAVVLVLLGSVVAGLVLAGPPGAAMGILAAALPLGLFAPPATAFALVAGVTLSLILSGRSGVAAAAVLSLLPFAGFPGGLE